MFSARWNRKVVVLVLVLTCKAGAPDYDSVRVERRLLTAVLDNGPIIFQLFLHSHDLARRTIYTTNSSFSAHLGTREERHT